MAHFIVSLMGNIFSRERPYLSFIAAQSESIIASSTPELTHDAAQQQHSGLDLMLEHLRYRGEDSVLVYGQRRAAIQLFVSDVFSHPIGSIPGKLTRTLTLLNAV